LIAASGLVGLLFYCGGYVIQIWRKRNARPSDDGNSSRGRRLAWMCLFMGLILVGAAGALREMTRSEGMLSGEDLFVVRASDDMAVEWLQDKDTVAAGEVLARFGSGSRTARADELRARLARVEAERDVLALSPLNADPELTRKHQAASQERAQVQQELGQAVAAAEASERDINSQLLTKKELLVRLERTLTEKKKDLDRANIRLKHNRELADSYSRLRNTRTISEIEYQDQQKVLRENEVEVTSLTQELKDGRAEKELLQTHLAKLEKERSNPAAPLRSQIAGLQARLERLLSDEKELKAALNRDLERSSSLRKAEMVQAVAKVREQQAAMNGLTGEQEIRAPFAGRVAYRTASPNATKQRGALLILGPEHGFLLTARLPRTEADALRTDGDVVLEVGEDSPERRIPARFRKAESLPNEPDQAALQLECQPPAEVVRRLADGEKLAVSFTWRPPLAAMWPFQVGAGLIAIGTIWLFLTRRQVSTSQAVAPWRGPTLDPVPLVNGLAVRFRGFMQGRADVGHLTGSANGRPHAIVDNDSLIDEAEEPELLEELEEYYRESLDRLNRAECPEVASRLLERLHQLRTTIRVLEGSANASLIDEADDETNHSILGAGS
jgi:hypothetical protein